MGERDTMAVLIAERDSEWQGWVDAVRSVADCVRVIAQRPSESASAFAARVRSEMQHSEDTIDHAVLAGGLGCDPEVLAARALVVHALTSRMSAKSCLHLDGTRRTGLAMEALAQIVSDQLQASGVEVVTTATEPNRAPSIIPLAA